MKNTAKTILKYVLKLALYLLSRCEHSDCAKYTHPYDDPIYDDDYPRNLEDKGV